MTKRGLKIATIGGGSSYTPELIEGFIKRYEELPVKDIYLVDIEEGLEKLHIVSAFAQRMVDKCGYDLQIHATLDREEALRDADFVTTQFRVGQLEARIRDERIPLRYNAIGQETTGAGGFANALRTVPVILDICEDMECLCPDAWLINFTNPSGLVTEAVLNHTSIKAIGLCNVPIGMKNDVAEKFDCTADDVYCDFVGINHLLWAQKIYIHGKDTTAEVLHRMAEDDTKEHLANIPDIDFPGYFLEALGLLPISYLKYYYLTDQMLLECITDAKEKGVRGEVVQNVEHELFELYKDVELNVKPPQLAERGGAHYSDAACSLINSIYNNKGDIQTVNVLNHGANLDLPQDAVIERNCVIDAAGAHPIALGHTPLPVRGLLQLVKNYEQLTIKAAMTGDYATALQALTIHPLVPSATAAKSMLDDILMENSNYLPAFRH
ncbi:MAG: 6-phospho-beta-glucosidase [Lachnospiraceae bacterium]|nr:6-phospho-beta-glucosidase [Lachnospiraceae bacterium]